MVAARWSGFCKYRIDKQYKKQAGCKKFFHG
jgi:hypothetical protein